MLGHAELAERLYAGLRDRDLEALGELLGPDSTWELKGRTALAGKHRGAARVLSVLRALGSLRPIRPDAYDVAASPHHAVLMTRLVGDGIDSDHAIVVVAEEGRLARAFHYVFDLYAFDERFPP